MKNIFINDMHEYDYISFTDQLGGNVEHKLITSNTGEWNEEHKGRVVLTIIDTGNNMQITFEKNKNNNIVLDYSQTQELLILLRIIDDCKIEIASKKLL
jgi:hypothetical protein